MGKLGLIKRDYYDSKTIDGINAIKELTKYGKNNIYVDGDVEVLSVGEYDWKKNHDYQVCINGKVYFKNKKGPFNETFHNEGNWIDIINQKINEKKEGFTFEELKTLYAEEKITFQKKIIELEKAQKTIKSFESEIDSYKNINKKLSGEKDAIKLENELLKKEIDKLKSEKKCNNDFDENKIVSFLYSGIKKREGLEQRHKLLRKLFHPDNFYAGTSLFQLVDVYYEKLKKQV